MSVQSGPMGYDPSLTIGEQLDELRKKLDFYLDNGRDGTSVVEAVRQQIKHHEAAAQRHDGARRQQHLESIRYLREMYDIPEPVIVKAIPPTELERLRARFDPHVASKPNWTTEELR